jgi:tetratricopeptide (TPR) repeat protein
MAQTPRCPHCGEELMPNHRYCWACGEPLPAAGRTATRLQTREAAQVSRGVDDYLKAVSTFERMLHGRAPDAARSMAGRGDALAALGEYDAAAQAYRDAIDAEPDRHETKLALARLYNRTARYLEAVRLSDEVLQADPSNREVYLVKARALLASGDFKNIIELAEQARNTNAVSAALTRVAELAKRRYKEVLHSSAIVQEVFVIHSSTRLVAHRSRLFRPNVDSDLVAGTLRAIQDFIQVALLAPEAGAPKMDELRYGSFIVLAESREHFQAAFVVSGTPDGAMRRSFRNAADEIERTFGETLAVWDGTLEHVRGVQLFLEERFFPGLGSGETESELELP